MCFAMPKDGSACCKTGPLSGRQSRNVNSSKTKKKGSYGYRGPAVSGSGSRFCSLSGLGIHKRSVRVRSPDGSISYLFGSKGSDSLPGARIFLCFGHHRQVCDMRHGGQRLASKPIRRDAPQVGIRRQLRRRKPFRQDGHIGFLHAPLDASARDPSWLTHANAAAVVLNLEQLHPSVFHCHAN